MTDDKIIPLDDVKPSIRRKLNALDVKALSMDGAFWFALFLCAGRLYPPFAEWAEQNKDAFIPLYVVLVGHFGIRYRATGAKGSVIETETMLEGTR